MAAFLKESPEILIASKELQKQVAESEWGLWLSTEDWRTAQAPTGTTIQ